MKIVFFGSSDFSVPSLEKILNSTHRVVAVVTQPDRLKGRHQEVCQTPVKTLAVSHGIEVYQPENVNGEESIKYLKALKADVFVVVSYGEILSKDVLAIPKIFSVNLHPSLLPKYRGAAPINWAIIKGETRTGLTVMRMNEKTDEGDIMMQRKIDIEKDETAEVLSRRLSNLGAILLLDAIRFIKIDKAKFKRQGARGPYAPKLKKEDGLIDWKRPAKEIQNKVRGLVPWPVAYTTFEDKTLKIWKSRELPLYEKMSPGKIFESRKEGLYVVCGKNSILIEELQLEGSKRMDAASFARGRNIPVGTFLGGHKEEIKQEETNKEEVKEEIKKEEGETSA